MKPEQLLGKRIRELRRTHQMTIEQLAERAGINDKYLGSIERGEQNPSFINRLIIVWTYGMCLWYIYMHENERCSEVGS